MSTSFVSSKIPPTTLQKKKRGLFLSPRLSDPARYRTQTCKLMDEHSGATLVRNGGMEGGVGISLGSCNQEANRTCAQRHSLQAESLVNVAVHLSIWYLLTQIELNFAVGKTYQCSNKLDAPFTLFNYHDCCCEIWRQIKSCERNRSHNIVRFSSIKIG